METTAYRKWIKQAIRIQLDWKDKSINKWYDILVKVKSRNKETKYELVRKQFKLYT